MLAIRPAQDPAPTHQPAPVENRHRHFEQLGITRAGGVVDRHDVGRGRRIGKVWTTFTQSNVTQP